jgi:hypothetical protein
MASSGRTAPRDAPKVWAPAEFGIGPDSGACGNVDNDATEVVNLQCASDMPTVREMDERCSVRT